MPLSHISIFCTTCNEARYRSIEPLDQNGTLDPDKFVAVSPDVPPPRSDGPVQCYVCQGTMRALAEEPAPPTAQATLPLQRRPSVEELVADSRTASLPPTAAPPPSHRIPSPPTSPTGTDVLFEVRDGEELITVQDTGSSLVAVTTKRIVRVVK